MEIIPASINSLLTFGPTDSTLLKSTLSSIILSEFSILVISLLLSESFSNFKIKSPFSNSLTARSPNSNLSKLFLICEIFIFSLVLISIIVPPLKSTP